MRVARAFRLPITAIMTALALSGCMRTAGPVAVARRKAISTPWPMARLAPARSRSPIQRRRRYQRAPPAFAASPRAAYAAAAAPRSPPRRVEPVRYDASYHLDAGDKLRVVVYGQEGLTNTYAIDAGGSITMPLIGAVPARGRTPAGLAAEISAQAAQRLHSRSFGRRRDRSLPAVLHPRRSRSARAISLRAQHDGRERGRDRRRLLAARQARPRDGHPHGCFRDRDATLCRPARPISPGDTVLVGERWF